MRITERVGTSILKAGEYLAQLLSVTNEKAWNPHLWNLYGSQSLSGEAVDEYKALTYSAVWNAITLIAGTIGSLPLHLMQRGRDRKRRVADERNLYKVMHDAWNPYMTAMAGRETMTAHILSWGNGYAEIQRNFYGEVNRLWPIPPDRIKVKWEDNDLAYEVRVAGEVITLPRESILHIPGLGFDGFMGYSVISMARKSIGLGMAMETFGSLYFGQGTHPGIIVSHPGKLSPTGSTNLSTSLQNKYGSLGKSHRLLLLEEGMKVEKIGIPPEDSQFLESRQFQVPEIARWFNLPPHKLKDLTRSSFNNIESEQISFVTDSILPWLVRFEQNYNMQLLTPSDREYSGRGQMYFKHVVEGLLRGDSKSRGDYYGKMFNIGAFTINDIRDLEDKDPSDHPLADEHFVPMNMVPLSMVKEQMNREPRGVPPRKNGEDRDGMDQDGDEDRRIDQ